MHISWDDLQTVEALVRTGSVVGAARELSLRHSSISRRVDALERSLGAPLFLRGARLRPTPLGLSIAERAARMRTHAQDIDAFLEEQERARAGRLVITTNDVLAPLLFGALRVCDFTQRVQVRISESELALEPGVTDLALRPSHTPGGSLRGQRLGRLRLGVFHARSVREGAVWIQPSASLRARASMRWWKVVPEDAASLVECDTLLGLRDACVAGLGRSVLPALLAEGDPRLLLEQELPGGPPVWLLSAATRRSDTALRRIRESLSEALRRAPGAWEK
jgi:DNA-binding transcriptional LysR family regulator